MRSCLRRPLAPGISRVRAMRLSSVIFFSFNSEMVIFTYGGSCGGVYRAGILLVLSRFECLGKRVCRGPEQGRALGCAALLELGCFRCCYGRCRRAFMV